MHMRTDGAKPDLQQQTQQNDATRCQKCAYKKGLCAICGVMVLDTSRQCHAQYPDR